MKARARAAFRQGFRPTLILALAVVCIAMSTATPMAQAAGQEAQEDARVTEANFRLAARFAPYKVQKLIHSTSVNPRWIEGTEKFWYEYETGDGKTFWLVDPVRGSKNPVFDHTEMAAELTRLTKDPYDRKHLPIERIRWIDENTIHFDVTSSQDEEEDEEEEVEEEEMQQEEEDEEREKRPKKKIFHFEYDLTTNTLRELVDWEAPPNHPDWASISPDKQWVVYARHHNLWMMDYDNYQRILDARSEKEGDEADEAEDEVEDLEEIQLTDDGEEYYSYGFEGRGDTDKEREEKKDRRKRAGVVWAKDSSKLALVRSDERESGELWVIHSTGNKRPELETYKYDMPGEENVTQQEIVIIDIASRDKVVAQAEAFKDQSLSIARQRQFPRPDALDPQPSLWLSDNADELYFIRSSRDLHRIDAAVANTTTGEVRTIIKERLNTYVEVQSPELLPNGDLVWWSERDGWGHYYLYGNDGTVKNQITSGPWSCRGILNIDETNRVIYFEANAREEGEDPYYQHLYKVSLDGTGLALLNPGDFDHRARISESNRFFVDNYSRVNTTPTSALFNATGDKVLDLEEADFDALTEAGYQFPEPYTVKADDGITDLYGVMYKPFDFDPEKIYPIIAYVYPGPQTEAVSKSFSTNATETALAQFGFIVITIGNRGGHPARSKWYHNYGYGNLRDYGLADKKAAIEQLSYRHDYIDIDRVGIYGHSGGGFMSTAAMLVYPDFFKVAVSSSGNHENNVYNRWWSEKHHGVKEVVDDEGNVTFEYSIEKNSELAKNLKGHLLLTTGDVDNNVHPAGTLRMAEALINANKRFDFFIFPGQQHGYRGHMGDYWFWLRAEYFVKNLLGDYRWDPDIMELNVEQQQTGGRGGG
jgi:dipeptidyl aminopeptidase/acylaminoacyl peptidase